MITLYDIFSWLFPQAWIVLLLTWAILFVCPRELYPKLVAFLVPFWVVSWWVIFRPVPFTDGWAGLEHGLVTFALIASVIAAIVRYSASNATERWGEGPGEVLDWRIAKVGVSIAITGGLLIELSHLLARTIEPAATLVLLLFTSVACLILSIFLKNRGVSYGVLCSIGATIFVGVLSIVVWPFIVVQKAEDFANGAPFCLLVADGDVHNRSAKSLLELSPLIMRAKERAAHAYNRHGYIVIAEQRSAHWSYMQADFVDVPTGTMGDDNRSPDTRCNPMSNFISDLPII